jgi:hypothetical protein
MVTTRLDETAGERLVARGHEALLDLVDRIPVRREGSSTRSRDQALGCRKRDAAGGRPRCVKVPKFSAFLYET